MSKWIDINVELPPLGKDVAVKPYDGHAHDFFVAKRIRNLLRKTGWSWSSLSFSTKQITHWKRI